MRFHLLRRTAAPLSLYRQFLASALAALPFRRSCQPLSPSELTDLMDPPLPIQGITVIPDFVTETEAEFMREELEPFLAKSRQSAALLPNRDRMNVQTVFIREGFGFGVHVGKGAAGMDKLPRCRSLVYRAHDDGLIPSRPEVLIAWEFPDNDSKSLVQGTESANWGENEAWTANMTLFSPSVVVLTHRIHRTGVGRLQTRLLLPERSLTIVEGDCAFFWNQHFPPGKLLQFKDISVPKRYRLQLSFTSLLKPATPFVSFK